MTSPTGQRTATVEAAARARWVERRVRGSHVVQFGIGGGELTAALLASGIVVTAVDADPHARTALEVRLDRMSSAVRANARLQERLSVPVDDVSCIVMWDGLQRLGDGTPILPRGEGGPVLITLQEVGVASAGRGAEILEAIGDFDRLGLRAVDYDLVPSLEGDGMVWMALWDVRDEGMAPTLALVDALTDAARYLHEAALARGDDAASFGSERQRFAQRSAALQRQLDQARQSVRELGQASDRDRALFTTIVDRLTKRMAQQPNEVAPAVARGVGGGRWLGPLGSRVGGLRVGFVGRVGWGLLGGVVSSVVVEPGGSLGEAVGGWLDVLVVDAVPVGFGAGEVVGLVEEARSLGAQVVGVESGGVPVWSGVVDVVCGVEAGPGVEVVAPSVEVGVVNPVGYRRVVDGRLAVVGPVSRFRDGFEDLVGVLREVALSVGVDVVDGSGVAALVGGWPEGVRVVDGPGEGGLIDRLRGYAGVVDHPALHGSVVDRALWVVTLCAAGVPVVVVDMSVELAELLGEELVGVLSGVDAGGLSDPEERDRVSVQTRRIALRDHARSQRWVELMDRLGMWVRPLPLVSVVLATNRREFLDHAVGQVERQSYPNVELVVVLHGDGFGDIEDADLMARLGGRVRVVRVDAGVVFGEALNRGVAASLGGLVAKMDDDDWYGADHLWDLVLAMEYSGATLVGKAAEFVYLEELDITLRRMVAGAEAYSRTLGGGALMIHRHDLDTIGGWRRVPRHVDKRLIDDVLSAERTVYRATGMGYVLARRQSGHTWDVAIDYFLSQSDAQWRGLRPDVAESA